MASDEIYEFTVQTPAGTTQANPLVTPTVFPSRIVERIRWRVPAGALGVMGWRISMRTVPVIPRNAGGWIVAHATSGEWDLRNQPDTGDWSVTTYNTGSFQHALYLTFMCKVIEPPQPILALAGGWALSVPPDPEYTGA